MVTAKAGEILATVVHTNRAMGAAALWPMKHLNRKPRRSGVSDDYCWLGLGGSFLLPAPANDTHQATSCGRFSTRGDRFDIRLQSAMHVSETAGQRFAAQH